VHDVGEHALLGAGVAAEAAAGESRDGDDQEGNAEHDQKSGGGPDQGL
jgi:hypothetical protein